MLMAAVTLPITSVASLQPLQNPWFTIVTNLVVRDLAFSDRDVDVYVEKNALDEWQSWHMYNGSIKLMK